MGENLQDIDLLSETGQEDLQRESYIADLQRRFEEGERFARVQYRLGVYVSENDGTYTYDEFGRQVYRVQSHRVTSCSYPDRSLPGGYAEEKWDDVRQRYVTS